MHEADVVLHVRDIAHPAREDRWCDAAVSVDERRMCPHLEEQAELVREVLADAKIHMERVVEARGQSNLHRH